MIGRVSDSGTAGDATLPGRRRRESVSCVVTFCAGGGNGALTAMALQELGYRDVATVEGGFMAWVDAGLPTVPVES